MKAEDFMEAIEKAFYLFELKDAALQLQRQGDGQKASFTKSQYKAGLVQLQEILDRCIT